MLTELAIGLVLAADLNLVSTEPELVAPRADVPVVVEGPYWVWGLRNVIRNIEMHVDLDIVYHRGATCKDYPDRRCLTVSYLSEPDAKYFGYYRYDDEADTYSITLNSGKMPWARPLRVPTAAHEFGHFLGFTHHDDDGLMGEKSWYRYVQPSEAEYGVLQEYYVPMTEVVE
jgi:hypothetical protein